MKGNLSELAGVIGAVLSIGAVVVEGFRSAGDTTFALNLLSVFLTTVSSLAYIGFLAGLATVGKRASRPPLVVACYALIAVLLAFVAITLGLLFQLQIAAYAAPLAPVLLFARWFSEMSVGFSLMAARRNLGRPSSWAGAAAVLLGAIESMSSGVALVYIIRIPFLLLGAWLLRDVCQKEQTFANSQLQI